MRWTRYVRGGVGRVSRADQSVSRREGVRVVDRVSGTRREDDRAGAGGGAGARARRGGAPVPRRGAVRSIAICCSKRFRQADFALNHLAVGEDLAKAWSVVED